MSELPHVVEDAAEAGLRAHENQIAAARAILEIFRARRVCYVLLRALLQAGKTGTFQTLARLMIAARIVDHVYILCGSNETLLRDQAEEDTRTYNRDHFVARRIKVVFRQDFPKTDMETRRALLIVDESHLDSGEGQMMSEFLARHGLDLAGTTDAMRAQETYICSVSATPFAEHSKILDGSSVGGKAIVTLKAGAGYFGLADYETAGKLKAAFDFAAEPERFKALLTASATPKWILFRCRNNATSERRVRTLCREAGVRVLEYTSKRSEVAITADELKGGDDRECMEAAPTVTTLVLVQGRLCVGKVVPKAHVAFVWENSADPKTDTLVQGLPGRMCGYVFGAEKPDIYVPAGALEERKRSVVAAAVDMPHADSEMGRYSAMADAVCLRGTHMVGGRVALAPKSRDGLPTTQCPPIPLVVAAEDVAEEADWTDTTCLVRALGRTLTEDEALLRGTPEQNAEMLAILAEAAATGATWTPARRYLKSTTTDGHFRYFVEVAAAAATGTVPGENVGATEPPRLTFCVVTPEAERSPHWGIAEAAGIVPGNVYAIFYTHAAAALSAVHTKSRTGTTRTDTVFDRALPAAVTSVATAAARTHVAAVAAAVGGAGTGDRAPEGIVTGCLSEAVKRDPAALRAALRELVTVQHRGHVDIKPFITCFHPDRAAYHWVSKTDNDLVRLLVELGPRLGVKFTTKFDGRCDKGKPWFYVEYICWA